MTRLRGFFARMRKDDNGATMIEYSILIGLITAAVIGLIVTMGDYVVSQWSAVCSAATGAAC